jgi:cytochrome oxidase Cu insertion factor (SCO1/SenC/PrrC family)
MKTPVRLLGAILTWTLLMVATLPGPVAAEQAPDEEPGIKVGAKAPTFTLMDQTGKERSLDEFLKAGKVALVFYRSAGW